MYIKKEIIKSAYNIACEDYNNARDFDEDDYIPWDKLNLDMQLCIESAVEAAFSRLIEDMYGGGYFNDDSMFDYTTITLQPFVEYLRENK